MPLKIQCSACNSRLTVKDDLAGKQVKCPKCKTLIRISAPSAAISPEATTLDIASGDEDYEEDEDDLFHDPYGDVGSTLPPPKRSTTQRPAKTATPPKAATSDRKPLLLAALGSLAGVLLGLLLGFLVFRSSSEVTSTSNGSSAIVLEAGSADGVGQPPASPPASDAANAEIAKAAPAPVKLPPPKPERTAEQLAEAADLKQVLGKIQQMIAAGEDREFLIQYAPVEELRKLQSAESRSQPLPEIPRDVILNAIQAVSTQVADVDGSAITATFEAETNAGSNSQWSPGPGYDGDVQAAIQSSLADLEAGKFRDFIVNMFPPDAVKVLFRNGPEQTQAAMINQESALVVRMLQDLKALAKQRPQVTGDVAEFSLSPVEYSQEQLRFIRPAGTFYPTPDRIIRFSRIDGHWRFYDDGSLRKTGALDGNIVRLAFERVGASWRLVSYPRQ